ncbi:hypothetical protein [Petroclostridium sp. X23]|uniref:hypothetical protein n=1 Tax=Petroclostridium sp. X23 TaxID=3045146 RepID=UPI0024AD3379|nr:hypothetical protein [Petroclostridium sp. X23]WHH58789.1 hypothetical protein QKW49_23850 [Petroclostridium sp. X23]
MKKYISFISGVSAAVILIPGVLMIFQSPAGWNAALITLFILLALGMLLSVIAAIVAINQPKGAKVLFIIAGVITLLYFLLMMFMLLSMEITVLLTALSIILMFAGAFDCAKNRQGKV